MLTYLIKSCVAQHSTARRIIGIGLSFFTLWTLALHMSTFCTWGGGGPPNKGSEPLDTPTVYEGTPSLAVGDRLRSIPVEMQDTVQHLFRATANPTDTSMKATQSRRTSVHENMDTTDVQGMWCSQELLFKKWHSQKDGRTDERHKKYPPPVT